MGLFSMTATHGIGRGDDKLLNDGDDDDDDDIVSYSTWRYCDQIRSS